MAKNIVICLDGTGNQLKAQGNTNVLRLFAMLDLSDPAAQVAYYDPGVGTFSSRAAWSRPAKRLSRLAGLAFGGGLRTNLAEAYTYLMNTYEVGDRIYLLGFSRGAYTARALAGMLRMTGLLRPSSENLVEYAIAAYTKSRRFKDEDWDQVQRFAATFSVVQPNGRTTPPIRFLGAWDTVKAAGVLRFGDVHWPYTRELPHVLATRHAISIDEKRRPYREYPVEVADRPAAGTEPTIDEVWFAGVHSDVGGAFEDDPRLPQITLKWMVEGAREAGVLLRDGAYETECAVTEAHATEGTVHRMGRIWGLLTYRRRPVPSGAAVHASVRDRRAAGAYGPDSLDRAVYVDEYWTKPKPVAPAAAPPVG